MKKRATVNMSLSRYNDLVYMTLKKLYFESMCLVPRECDIRVCMQMGHRPLLEKAGLMAVILLPNEVSPRSHTEFYDIDMEAVFTAALEYMQDHWYKMQFPRKEVEAAHAWWLENIVPPVMAMPEEMCTETLPTEEARG